MNSNTGQPLSGGCACGAVRFQLTASPVFVNCCHCSWCQRETGSAFVINALIETNRVHVLKGQPRRFELPSASGNGQSVLRCPDCGVALWSHYSTARDAVACVRVGTLDEPERCPPNAHVFTSTKLPWVGLPDGVPAFESYYSPKELWPRESRQRYLEAIQA